jgi:hypothetical protein
MKLYANIIFNNGIEKMYNIDTTDLKNPKKFIEDTITNFKIKWKEDVSGGSFTFVTVQGRAVVMGMENISAIEMFLS